MEAAAIYVLVSVIFVSKLQHWWFVVQSVIWILILVAEQLSDFGRYTDKWSTPDAQIEYLYEGSDAQI